MRSYPYSSAFKDEILGLLEEKRTTGFPYESNAHILYRFDQMCASRFPNEISLSKEIVLSWSEKRDWECSNTLLRRITPVRQLAKYRLRQGKAAYILPRNIPNRQIRYKPYVFSHAELRTFFLSTDQCPETPYSGYRSWVIPLMFRLIYSCGLRPSEARKLRVEQVDLNSGALDILQSKGHKDRRIYMSEDMRLRCMEYDEILEPKIRKRTMFFPNAQDGAYGSTTLSSWLHEFGDSIFTRCRPRPRVYDLRHTFAVHCLNRWIDEKRDLNTMLPYLRVHMGHENFTDTDYYLHFVPEFYPKFQQIVLQITDELIPEVTNDEIE